MVCYQSIHRFTRYCVPKKWQILWIGSRPLLHSYDHWYIRVHTGSYRQDCVKFKDFSRTSQRLAYENLQKILIYMLKFYFWNARACAAPNKGTIILYWVRSQKSLLNPPVNGKIQGFFKDFECFSSIFQGKLYFQGLFKTVLYIQVLFKHVQTLYILCCQNGLFSYFCCFSKKNIFQEHYQSVEQLHSRLGLTFYSVGPALAGSKLFAKIISRWQKLGKS